MKLQDNPSLPHDLPGLVRQLDSLYRAIAQQVNSLSEGSIYASYTATTAAPTAGAYAQGDFVPNSAPVEIGSPGAMFVIRGWLCVASGDPGTWRECRVLTGN